MRKKDVFEVIRKAFEAACERPGFRLVEFSVQSNHLHLIVEADNEKELSRGMQGLLIRVAKALNRFWGRKGKLFGDRYHARILRYARQVRNVLAYVLHNASHHAGRALGALDLYTSGWWFDGWKNTLRITGLERVARPVADAKTWLLRKGWRKHGLIELSELPGR